jgi:hypothetical protein
MTQFQFLGLLFGISGAFIIATGDKVAAKLFGSKKTIEKVEDDPDEKAIDKVDHGPDEEEGQKRDKI